MGELLRAQASNESSGNAKWKMVNDLMSKGEMAPEVCACAIFVKVMYAIQDVFKRALYGEYTLWIAFLAGNVCTFHSPDKHIYHFPPPLPPSLV